MSAGVRLALDARALQVEGYADRGIGRYVAGYAAALHRRRAVGVCLLDPALPPPAGLPPGLVADGVAAWDVMAAYRSSEGSVNAWQVTAPFLGPFGPGTGGPWERSGLPRVVSLYDLIPLRAPRHYLSDPDAEARYRQRAAWVGAADLVLTISSHTRREAIALLGCRPEAVVDVGVGVSPFFSPADGTDEELFRFHFPRLAGVPFALTVTGSDARKATERLVSAVGVLAGRGAGLHLVVAGHLTGPWRRAVAHAAAAAGVAGRVVLAGAVSDEVLRAAYRRAVYTVMPSLAEGAGLPVLESAACGTPCLASSTSALGETAAHPAARFDPDDTDHMVEAMARALASEEDRASILAVQQAAAAAATWDAVAGRALAAVSALQPRPPVPLPPRWAVVACTPVPARHPALAALGAVEVVDPGDPDFEAAHYDGVVYLLGGWAPAEVERPVAALAGRWPGWVLLPSPLPPPSVLAALAGRSRGLVVADPAERAEAERAFPPPGRPPPITAAVPAAG